MDNIKLDQLFKTLDIRELGYLERDDLQKISDSFGLSNEAFDELFGELDANGDGKIENSDFSRVFHSLMTGNERRNSLASENDQSLPEEKQIPIEQSWNNLFQMTGNGLPYYQSQEAMYDFFKQLHYGGFTSLTSQFELLVTSINTDMKQQKLECDHLQESFKREKEIHKRQIGDLEEELELQLKRVEEKVQKEVRSQAESECNELQRQHKQEMMELQSHLKVLQALESRLNDDTERSQICQMKKRIEELCHENRVIRNTLTEAQTNIVILRSDLMHSRSVYEEKCRELENEKEVALDYLCDHDNLTKQLQLLLQTNKKLQDTNDMLRQALQAANLNFRRERNSRSPCGSIRSCESQPSSMMSDFNDEGSISSTHSNKSVQSRISNVSLPISEISHNFSQGYSDLQVNNSPVYLGKIPDANGADDADSGFSTILDLTEPETDIDEPSFSDDRIVTSSPSILENENFRPKYSKNINVEPPKIIVNNKPEESIVDKGTKRTTYIPSCPQSSNKLNQDSKIESKSKTFSNPQRMFKIVLAGDSAVGKSSFIMRLCKGQFLPFISSTVGVDTQVKTLEIDGKTVALQLWDTAGQERFQSLARFYFRRADGVLLLYDCSCEQSFLNVRHWIESIMDFGTNEIPIMMCANKTDLKDTMRKETQNGGFVDPKEGRRIAKENKALFYEISAKNGTNINEAIIDLARLLTANEDFQVKTDGLQLTDAPLPIKKPKCCFL